MTMILQPFINKAGKTWAERQRYSENYFKANSHDWLRLRELYNDIDAQRKRWGTNVSIAWAIVNNMIADEGLSEVDVWMQGLKTNAPNLDLEERIRSFAKTLHRVNATKDVMDRARVLCALYGYAMHWSDFKQVSQPAWIRAQDGSVVTLNGKPQYEVDDDGQTPLMQAVNQQIVGELVSPYDLRHDPDGRRWDLKDHKWLTRIYTKTLAEFKNDPDYDSRAVKVLERWVEQQMRDGRHDNKAVYGNAGYDEKDPLYKRVLCYEIWSGVEQRVFHLPVGTEFVIKDAEFPPWAAESGLYPGTMIAYSWDPDDADGKKGFYPIPDLRLIRSQLENINKLERIYVDYATTSVKKYFVPDGVFDPKAIKKIQSTETRELIEVDLGTLFKKLGINAAAQDISSFDMRRLIMLMPNEESSEAVKHLEAISHELDMIYQTVGQGPSDRGGLAAADSATESINIRQMLDKRINKRFNLSLDIIDSITEKFLLILKYQQTLPVDYLLATDDGDEVWDQFFAADIRDIDLAFRMRTNASRPLTRAEYQMQLKEAMQLATPLIQSGGVTRETRFMIRALFRTFDIPGLAQMFADEVPELAMQFAQLIQGLAAEQVDMMTASTKIIEIGSALSNALLGPAHVQKLAQQSAETPVAEGAGEKGIGSQSNPHSTGQVAYADAIGKAAAGTVGGLAQ
jgi:hypothetical protein